MKSEDTYFNFTRLIWEAYFETRAGKRFGETAVSWTKREELLKELRAKIKVKESSLNDKELIKKIEEARALSLQHDIKNAFKK
jgi:hypothetical protein